jgi:hypothetical protein
MQPGTGLPRIKVIGFALGPRLPRDRLFVSRVSAAAPRQGPCPEHVPEHGLSHMKNISENFLYNSGGVV